MSKDRQDLRIAVRLTPKAARNAIQEWAADADGGRILKVSVTAVPEKGKANKALIEMLAAEWDIPRRAIEILKGAADRNKILIIKDISSDLATRILL